MPKSVLIVEDEALIALDLETHLQKLGYEVPAIASSGVEAIQMMKEIHPDLVLMDIRIKGAMDGVEAAEHIHQRFDVPVVYVTAHTDRDTLERAKRTDPFGFVAKPVTSGNLAAAVAIALHKHAAEREVRQREAWLATTLSSVGHAMIVTDAEGQVRFLNGPAERLIGVDAGAAIGRSIREMVVLATKSGMPLDTDLVRLCFLRGKAIPLPPEIRLRRADGQEHEIEGQIAPSTQSGMAVGSVLTFNDVGERNRNEVQRKRAEVARAIARLAAATSKDLGDLLTVVLSSGQRLEQSLGSSDPLQNLVRQLTGAGESAVQLTSRLTRLAREEVALPALVNLNEVIEGVGPALMRSLPPEVQLSTASASDLPSIFVDPAQMRELVTLLVSYASASMPEGGRIDLETGWQQADAGAPRFIRLIVRYGGPLLEPQELEQLFGASRTLPGTRSQRVDLFIVLAILADIGGHISAHSTPQGRNWFEVLIPEALREELPSFLADPSDAGDLRPAVLLVEPNAQMREAMCETLSRTGYRCIAAADDADALFASQLYEGKIELLLSAAPAANQPWPLLEILTSRPEVRFLITSAASGRHPELEPSLAARTAFLKVPFQEHQLREAIEHLLEAASTGPSRQ